eukprot:503217-Amphidinium_carterae.1
MPYIVCYCVGVLLQLSVIPGFADSGFSLCLPRFKGRRNCKWVAFPGNTQLRTANVPGPMSRMRCGSVSSRGKSEKGAQPTFAL